MQMLFGYVGESFLPNKDIGGVQRASSVLTACDLSAQPYL